MYQIYISIIIPHFNRPPMLSKLLSTIPNNPNIEVLVIDDHSTAYLSDLYECKLRYSNMNIVFYENSDNKKGAGTARNLGITLAKGKYLLFADSDDWFLPEWETILKAARSSNADIIFFPPTSQALDGRVSRRHQDFANLIYLYLNCPSHRHEIRLRYQYCSPWSKLIKRKMVKDNHILFDETPYSEDMLFTGKIGCLAKQIQVIDKVIYCISEHNDNNTSIINEYAIKYRQKMNNRYYLFLVKNIQKKDFLYINYPYKNHFMWFINILSVFLYELQHGYIAIGDSKRKIS